MTAQPNPTQVTNPFQIMPTFSDPLERKRREQSHAPVNPPALLLVAGQLHVHDEVGGVAGGGQGAGAGQGLVHGAVVEARVGALAELQGNGNGGTHDGLSGGETSGALTHQASACKGPRSPKLELHAILSVDP